MNTMLKKVTYILGLCIFVVSSAISSDQLGIIASVKPSDQRAISIAVNTSTAVSALKQQTSNIYWLARNDLDTYHITLDLFKPTQGGLFSTADMAHLETMLKNFVSHAKNLNRHKNPTTGKRAYVGSGYELRLFVHFADGTHEQYTKKTINNLLTAGKDVNYANLVLKLGTHMHLSHDWEAFQKYIAGHLKHSSVFQPMSHHKIETHITIANIYKYNKNVYKVVNGQITGGKMSLAGKPFTIPFKGVSDLQILVDAFNDTNNNTDWTTLKNRKIRLDRIQVTEKVNGQINVLKTVRF